MKLTVKQAAAEIGETSAVVRNWLRDFKSLIPTVKGDNGYNMFGPEAMQVLHTIKKLHRDQGFSTKQIEYHLSTGAEIGAAKAIEEAKPGQMDQIQNMLQTIMDHQHKQDELNRRIIQRMDDRDKILNEFISFNREQRLIESAVSKSKRKKTWWDRLRGDRE